MVDMDNDQNNNPLDTREPSIPMTNDNDHSSIDELRNQIHMSFQKPQSEPELPPLSSPVVPQTAPESAPPQTPENQETQARVPQDLGVEQTYQSDFSRVIGSHEPKVMSELLRKERFEEERKKIRSPRSKKNLLYISGVVLLLIGIIALVSFAFGGKESVRFIQKERVASLVPSDRDTGINTTTLEASKTKQAIAKVIKTKINEDQIHQIYYIEQQDGSVLRRLGAQEVFAKTQSKAPQLFLDNIEEEFMHGVYKTDDNYPFLVFQVTSYDRALDGLREWEPTMVDDLAPYLDLPKEALERSLIENGFADEIIKNKIVRVARYVPRQKDASKGGFLDSLLGRDSVDESNNTDNENIIDVISALIPSWHVPFAYAQINVGTQGGTAAKPDDVDIVDTKGTTVGTNGAINVFNTDLVCFDYASGDRIQKDNPDYEKRCNGKSFDVLLFQPYRCNRIECKRGNQTVSSLQQGQPGVVCTETDEELDYNSQLPKRCYQFPDLMNLQNIESANLCFDANGKYLPGVTRISDDNIGGQCTHPLNRADQMCINDDGEIIIPTATTNRTNLLCFNRFNYSALDATTSVNTNISVETYDNMFEQFQTLNGTLRQQAAAIAYELRAIISLASFLGVSDDTLEPLEEAADFFYDVAKADILEVDAIRRGAEIVQKLEAVLDRLDPQGTWTYSNADGSGNVFTRLRNIIELVKRVLGLSHNLTWITLNGKLPLGTTIYAGQSVSGVTPIQQALVLIGFSGVQVNGTLNVATQNAITSLQYINGLNTTGIANTQFIALLNSMIQGKGILYGNTNVATINGLFTGNNLGLGAYNQQTQSLQILLYSLGYQINAIDGVFDVETCRALQQFQTDYNLEVASDGTCIVSKETIQTLNDIVEQGNYIGSGFEVDNKYPLTLNSENQRVEALQGILKSIGYYRGDVDGVFDAETCKALQQFEQAEGLPVSNNQTCEPSPETIARLKEISEERSLGLGAQLDGAQYLRGTGVLAGIVGPGSNPLDFVLNEVEASGLREGDVVLMYMFLDEKTLLITSHESVITEVVKRRAFRDIFDPA